MGFNLAKIIGGSSSFDGNYIHAKTVVAWNMFLLGWVDHYNAVKEGIYKNPKDRD